MTENIAWTFCQICRAECGMIANLQEGRVVSVEGDPEDEWSRGKLCVKGRNAPQIYHRRSHRLTWITHKQEAKTPLPRLPAC